MTDDPEGDPMPLLAFALVFLAAPVILGLVIVAVQYGQGLGDSPLALALVLGHAAAGLGFAAFYAFYRRSR